MNTYYCILMIIFGVLIFLYGLQIYASKNPVLPAKYHGKRTKSYLKFYGKAVITVSPAPILSGLVSLLGDSGIIMILSLVTLVLFFIIGIVISCKLYKEE